jgi:hypothetical protein
VGSWEFTQNIRRMIVRRHLGVPSAPTVIACLALFVALGGTSYAAIKTVLNAKRLGGKPASAYLLKSQQPLRSTGFFHLNLGQSKTLFTLAAGKLEIQAKCVNGGSGYGDAEIVATPKEKDVYWLSNSAPIPEGVPETLVSTGPLNSSYVGYAGSDLTTPQGDYYFVETFGVDPGSPYKGNCVFDDRVTT